MVDSSCCYQQGTFTNQKTMQAGACRKVVTMMTSKMALGPPTLKRSTTPSMHINAVVGDDATPAGP